MAQSNRFAPPRGALELQCIVVDADDPGAREAGDLDQRSADATAQVDRRHAGPEAEPVSDIEQIRFIWVHIRMQ